MDFRVERSIDRTVFSVGLDASFLNWSESPTHSMQRNLAVSLLLQMNRLNEHGLRTLNAPTFNWGLFHLEKEI